MKDILLSNLLDLLVNILQANSDDHFEKSDVEDEVVKMKTNLLRN